MESLLSLLVRPGESLSAEKWNALVAAVERRTLRRGANVRLRRGVDCTHVSFTGGRGGGLPATSLRVSITSDEDGSPAATVSKGLIGGFEPQIEGTPVSKEDSDGQTPLFKLDPSKVIDPKTGIGLFYARVHLWPDWSIQKVELEARSTPPPSTAWRGYKLLAFLRRTPADDDTAAIVPIQRVFFDLGHTTSQRVSGGKARHWFWAM